MSVKTKAQIAAEIASEITTNGNGDITAEILAALLVNIKDSYEDFILSYTTDQRDLLTGTPTRYIIYNTTNKRYEFYDGAAWQPFGFPRHKIYYIKASGNNNFTTDQNDDWRLIESGGNLVYQKYEAGVWTNKAEIA